MTANYKFFTDGAYDGVSGGLGVYEENRRFALSASISTRTTSNINEYLAVFLAIICARELYQITSQTLNIFSDSRLVVEQVNGNFAINAKHLFCIKSEIDNSLSKSSIKLNLKWTSREFNQKSDALAKSATKKAGVSSDIIVLNYCSVDKAILKEAIELTRELFIRSSKLLQKTRY
jgi:ribonuclease HI